MNIDTLQLLEADARLTGAISSRMSPWPWRDPAAEERLHRVPAARGCIPVET
jgi:hypothetical protein